MSKQIKHLQDRLSAARSQRMRFEKMEKEIQDEIYALGHKAKIGDIIKPDHKSERFQVTGFSEFWVLGMKLKKDGTPGGQERAVFGTYKIIEKGTQ